jgi:CheY-like chemotaxis protein
VAENGAEALALAETHRPDLILMDIQMPKVDGLTAIRQMRANPVMAPIPIIALTALAMPADQEKCLAAGANAYLAKPVRLKSLVETMQRLLEEVEG